VKTSRTDVSETHALRILKEVAETLNSAPSEERAVSEALKRVADLLGLQTGWVWLRDQESGQFYSAAAQRLPPYLQEPVRMAGRPCWCLELFQTGRLTARNIDVLECSRLSPAVRARRTALTRGLRCHASVPLYAGDRPLGIMNLATRGWRRLTRRELDLLTTIASQVGVAIERARLAERSVNVARAEERSRMAREIHDTLAQGLTAVALQIEAALSHLGRRDRAVPRLERALDVARASLDEARRSVRALRVAAMDGRSLADSLAAMARRFTADTGVRVHLDAPSPGILPTDVESELFRIASEALTNVRKHARAREVTIRLTTARRRVRLVVADEGVGFRVRGARRRGFGLLGMEDRARLVGGSLSIRSVPGRGTVLTTTVPLGAAS
jgi:two-component system NarL family sensor kinase